MGQEAIRATGNHPFFVIRGGRLALRPPPQDVPEEEQGTTGGGRWVEARDLRVGDVLKDKGGEGVTITDLSSRQDKIEVYNLRIEGYHNYSVLQRGILVHNMKMGGGDGEGEGESRETERSKRKRLITVYGKVTLKHYEVSILGAADASALMGWLQKNGYQVNPEAEEVLNTYIEQNWAFVAVKLNPGKKRHYENEFLPPLTIRYHYDHLIYPLRLSSVSTTQTAKITLYVIAESTASSSNFSTTTLRYDRNYKGGWDPKNYIEESIQRTMRGKKKGALVVMWKGKLHRGQISLGKVIRGIFLNSKKAYLTRLETRIHPSDMNEDIIFTLDDSPLNFNVHITRKIVKYLAQKGSLAKKGSLTTADVNVRDKDGWTALMRAAYEGHTEIVHNLLQAGADVNARNEYGRTALISAAWGGHTEIVQILLQAGADVNTHNNDGITALMLALLQGHSGVAQLLIKEGADVNAKANEGATALMLASQYGHIEVAQLLIEEGVDVSAKDNEGYTALMLASQYGYPKVAQLLIEAGADVNAKASEGATALIVASQYGHIEVAQLLIKEGADVNAKASEGATALMLASQYGYPKVAQLLIEKGVDVSAKDNEGYTALMLASRYGHIEVAQLLIEEGADVNAKASEGATALMVASQYGHIEVVQLLIKEGADVNAQHNEGWTALRFARIKGHEEIAQLLIKAGKK